MAPSETGIKSRWSGKELTLLERVNIDQYNYSIIS